ncbi:MAG: transporter substrate-binding domain-containing protein [Pseudomonadota bacterium]
MNSYQKTGVLCFCVFLIVLVTGTSFLTTKTEGESNYKSIESRVSDEFLTTLSSEEQAWLQAHPVIRVTQDPGWAPVEFTNDQGEPSGMSADYLHLVEQRLGITFDRVPVKSWEEAYAGLKNWEIDMTTSVALTPQRSDIWAFTEPYLNIPIVIATQSNVTYLADIKELFNKKAAVVKGYAIEDWVTRDFPEIELIRAQSTLDGLEMLQRGEVFAYLDNLLIIGDFQAKFKVSNIKIAGQTPYTNAQCMAVRKDWAPLAGILQKALASISEKERKEIYRKWLPVRYEHGFDYILFWKIASAFVVILLMLLLWNRQLTKEIKSRKQAEEALRDSEKRHRRYITSAPYGVFVADEQGRYLQVNPSVCNITGYTEQELLQMGISDLYFEDNAPEGAKPFQTAVLKGKYKGEMLFRPKNCDRRWWVLTVVRIPDSRFLGFCTDITERKQAEEKILEANTLLSSVLEGTTDAIFVKDKNGKYLLVNSGTCKAIGRDPEDIVGRNDSELFPAASADIINAIDRQVMTTGKTVLAEEKLQTTDGTTYWLVNKSPSFNEAHEINGLIGISRDITSIKRAEEEKEKLQEQLRQAQKMESIGQLAGGVAHDFNNMLGVILGHSEMALEKVDPSQSLYGNLREIRKAAERSAEITKQLLAFARKQTIAPSVLDLNITVQSMLKMLLRLIGEDIDLVWLPTHELWSVKTDQSQINQILVNLCVNARDAIAGVGKIVIETANCTLDEGYCINHVGFRPGEYVKLTVSDNGHGMNKETLRHIFEPFFTTKGVGQGTGLGLATVYGTVKQNNGFINAYSEPGQGATFSIYLPRHIGTNCLVRSEGIPALAVGGDEAILLVEDEPAILEMAKILLQNLGYKVLSASGSVEALLLVEDFPETIHLLITDVIMPEMSGRDLEEQLRKSRPGIKCLFMSGYTANIIASQGVLDDEVHFIQKPFSKHELAAKTREALDT